MFDTHAHLSSNSYNEDREIIIEEGFKKGITGIICVFSDFIDENIDGFFSLLKKYDLLYGAIGIHPHQALIADKFWHILENSLKKPKIIALGEIGLDYYYNHSPRDIQREVFHRQLLLSKECNLPVIVHSRNAMEDTIQVIKEANVSCGVIHCFSGNKQELALGLDMGLYISLSGIVTFPKAEEIREIAKLIPLDRLLLETDSPYLAPQPIRGKRNDPSFIEHIFREVAAIRNLSVKELEDIINQNVKKLFRVC